MNRTDIYDIDLDISSLISADGGLYDYFHFQELKQRRLVLNDDIDQCVIQDIVKHILFFNVEDSGKPVEGRTPITVFIASRGGNLEDGFELIDVIRSSTTPVYTVNIGYAYSMGFLIMLAGHKRYTMPNATFLLHDGSNFAWNSSAKAQDQMEFHKRFEKRIRDYVINRTAISAEEYDAQFRVEWYMFADEAKKYGVVDGIIGEDISLDALL